MKRWMRVGKYDMGVTRHAQSIRPKQVDRRGGKKCIGSTLRRGVAARDCAPSCIAAVSIVGVAP
jgi:hypothetical protein